MSIFFENEKEKVGEEPHVTPIFSKISKQTEIVKLNNNSFQDDASMKLFNPNVCV